MQLKRNHNYYYYQIHCQMYTVLTPTKLHQLVSVQCTSGSEFDNNNNYDSFLIACHQIFEQKSWMLTQHCFIVLPLLYHYRNCVSINPSGCASERLSSEVHASHGFSSLILTFSPPFLPSLVVVDPFQLLHFPSLDHI